MGDGSTCKQTSRCQAGGSIVQNKQGGGAKKVPFKLPSYEKEDCDFGIHSVGFDCNPPASTVPPQTPQIPTSTRPSQSSPVISSPVLSIPSKSEERPTTLLIPPPSIPVPPF